MRILVLLLFLPLFLSLPALTAQTAQEIDSINNKAYSLVDADPDTAIKMSFSALTMSEKTVYFAGQGDAYSALGYIYCNAGDYDTGYQYYDKAKNIRDKIGDKIKLAGVYSNISIFKRIEGNYPEAVDNGRRAVFELERLLSKEKAGSEKFYKTQRYLSGAKLNLSNLHEDYKDYFLALELAKEGYALAHSAPSLIRAGAANTLANRYFKACQVGDSIVADFADSAKYYYQMALVYYTHPEPQDAEMIDSSDIGFIYHNIALLTLLTKKDPAIVNSYLNLADAIFEAIGDTIGFFYTDVTRAQYFMAIHDYNAAINVLSKAQEFENIGGLDEDAKGEFYQALSEAYEASGRSDSAFIYLKKATTIKNNLFINTQQRFNHNQIALFDIEHQKNKIEKRSIEVEKNIWIISSIALGLLTLVIILLARNTFITMKRRSQAAEEVTKKRVESLFQEIDNKYLEGVEAEREEISVLLHNSIGNDVVALMWKCQDFQEEFEDESPNRFVVSELVDKTQQLSKDISNLSRRMNTVLPETGFVPAVTEVCNRLNEGKRLRAHFTYNKQVEKTSSRIEEQLLLILKELINNTMKHAKAKNIFVDYKINDNRVWLRYKDDGIGFNIAEQVTAARGYGMATVPRRIKKIGGILETGSAPNEGMWVEISVQNTGAAEQMHIPI